MSQSANLGSDSTTLEQACALASEPSANGISVLLIDRHNAHAFWVREGESAVVGRSFPAEVVVSNKSLSRQHARVRALSDRLHVYDLGSVNGVLSAGQRVPEALVAPGESVQLGGVTLKVLGPSMGGSDAALTPRGGAEVALAQDRAAARSEGSGQGGMLRGAATERLFELARRAARSRLPILVLGETGTGKELLAREIHAQSPRAAAPFHAVNCGALPPGLITSVLFGHEKGAFTGASQGQRGLFEQANGGTLFLDEIGELPPEAQSALLRVLETKTVARIGGSAERSLDVRVIAATHRDLAQMCERGAFRMDLLHRLNAVTLTLPPLRARRDEIVPLAEHFLRACEPREEAPRRIGREVVECLLCYEWPGNLRELRNAIERAAALALGDTIELDDLPDSVRQAGVGLGGRAEPLVSSERPALPEAEPVEAATPLSRRLQQYEADLIRRALAQASGHKTNAAKLLKMPLRTFMKRIKEYGID